MCLVPLHDAGVIVSEFEQLLSDCHSAGSIICWTLFTTDQKKSIFEQSEDFKLLFKEFDMNFE